MVQGIVAHGQVVGHTMCYINSAINPYIYYTKSQAFKDQVTKLSFKQCRILRNT